METLISGYRAWMCVFLGLLLVVLSAFLGRYRAIVSNTGKPLSLRTGPAGQLHRGNSRLQMTVTWAGHHLGQELEKNNYHYPCHEKALQARSC